MTAKKDALHNLIDQLPDDKIDSVFDIIQSVINKAGDPFLQILGNAPEDDESITDDDLHDIAEGRLAIAKGEIESLDKVMKEFGL